MPDDATAGGMEALPRQAVILAGGKATRLGELARDTPKPLLAVGGRPFIEHVILHCRRYGVRDFLILAGPFEDKFRAAWATGGIWACPSNWCRSPPRRGRGAPSTMSRTGSRTRF